MASHAANRVVLGRDISNLRMAQLEDLVRSAPVLPGGAERPIPTVGMLSSPVLLFLLLSLVFGALTLAITPPLRGPDEPSHFLRAYGISSGEIIPSTTDDKGRKSVSIPAVLHQQMHLYETALGGMYRGPTERWSFPAVLAEYARRRETPATQSSDPVLVPYAGSEGYSPIPYLPYLPGLAVARILDLSFMPTLYLMRISAFVSLTAVMAAAIAIVPGLPWAFVVIALLPSALFARVMISADGTSLAGAMVVAALCLRGACRLSDGGTDLRSLSMLLCVLAKPPQLVFVLSELLRRPFLAVARQPWPAAMVVLPAALAGVAWAVISAGDVAAWRIVEGTNNAPEQFQPLWKLRFMLEHPWHFLALLLGTAHYTGAYLLQLIGILGWLDMRLQEWVYPVLGLILLACLCGPLRLDTSARRRLTAVSGLIVVGYVLAVFMIFYMVWTPVYDVQIEGVQGRYFVAVLPFVAIILSALVRRGPPPAITRWLATSGSVLAGAATIEAILRSDWQLALWSL